MDTCRLCTISLSIHCARRVYVIWDSQLPQSIHIDQVDGNLSLTLGSIALVLSVNHRKTIGKMVI